MIWLGFGSTISLTLKIQHSASHSTKKPMMKATDANAAAQLRVHHTVSFTGRADTISSRRRCVMVTNSGV